MPVELEPSRYWPFIVLCVVALAAVVRLLLREQITLQGSISYLTFLTAFLLAALFPRVATQVAHAMGFALLSNFLFCIALIGFALLHLFALLALSRTERRTIQITQELALLEERLSRGGVRRE